STAGPCGARPTALVTRPRSCPRGAAGHATRCRGLLFAVARPPMSFRHRILLALLLLGAAPSAVLVAGWAATLLRFNPARSSQAALEPVRATGRELLKVLDTTRLDPGEHRALHAHTRALNNALSLSRSGLAYSRYRAVGLALP